MEQDFNSVHEQNVTNGLVLGEKAQIRALIPMMELILLVGLGFPFIAIFKPTHSIANMVLIIAFAVIAVSSIPAIRAFRVLSSFEKENKRAYKDGQKWIREQSFVNKSVFTSPSCLVKSPSTR